VDKQPRQHHGPGASAQREYERRHTARQTRAGQRFGSLGPLITRLVGELQTTQAWSQGAKAEALVADLLAKHLRGHDVVLLHDRRIPGRGRANIDHLAIGPRGVTVIDTKSTHGRLTLTTVGGLLSPRREQLQVNRRDCTHYLDALERQIAAIRDAPAPLELEVDIRGALCYPNINGLPLFGQLTARQRTIAIDNPRGIAKLARRNGPLDHELVDEIARQLDRALPPA